MSGSSSTRKRSEPEDRYNLALRPEEFLALIDERDGTGLYNEREEPASLEEKRQAFDFVVEYESRIKRRRLDEANALKNDFDNGNPQRRAEIIARVIDYSRKSQRTELLHELENLQHRSVSADLEKLAGKINVNPPQTTTSQISEGQRRLQWISAIQTMLGGNLPTLPTHALCGYDGILMACGNDEFNNYVLKTGRLRAAQQRLFDNERVCDTIDTALLCFSHDQCRGFSECGLSFYHSFRSAASAFLGDMDDETKLATQVHTRREKDESPTLPTMWGTWGDFKYRLVCKEFFRVVEANLLELEHLNWKDLQDVVFLDVMGTTKNGRPTGSVFMEEFDGELATEMMCVLFRCFISDDNSQAIDKMRIMPDIPKYVDGLEDSYTFGDIFTFQFAVASRKEKARAYVHRTLYTSLRSSWLLHAPAAPALFGALVRCANTLGFETRSLLPQDSINDGMNLNTKVKICMVLHREAANSISDGKQKAAQENWYRFLKARRAQQKKLGTQEGDLEFDPPEPMTEEQCWQAAHFQNIWKVLSQKDALKCMGGIMTAVFIDGYLSRGKYTMLILHAPYHFLKSVGSYFLGEFGGNPGSRTRSLFHQHLMNQRSAYRQAAILGVGEGLNLAFGKKAKSAWVAGASAVTFFSNNVMQMVNGGATVAMSLVSMISGIDSSSLPSTVDRAAEMGVHIEEMKDPWTFLSYFAPSYFNYQTPANAEAPATGPVAPHALHSTLLSIMGDKARNLISGMSPLVNIDPSTPASLFPNGADSDALAAVVSNTQPGPWNHARWSSAVSLVGQANAMAGYEPTSAISSMTSDLEERLDIVAPRPLLSAQTAAQWRTREPKPEFQLFCLPDTDE